MLNLGDIRRPTSKLRCAARGASAASTATCSEQIIKDVNSSDGEFRINGRMILPKTRKRRTLLTIPKWDRHGAPNTMMDNDKHRHKRALLQMIGCFDNKTKVSRQQRTNTHRLRGRFWSKIRMRIQVKWNPLGQSVMKKNMLGSLAQLRHPGHGHSDERTKLTDGLFNTDQKLRISRRLPTTRRARLVR